MLSDSFEFPLEAKDKMVKNLFSMINFDWPFKSAAGRSMKTRENFIFALPFFRLLWPFTFLRI